MERKYDILIVGAGLFGAVIAQQAFENGKSVLVLDRRPHIGGNCFTDCIEGINVHKYGAHIFRTSNRSVWNYMERFCEFNNFVNSPVANFEGELLNLPFNMNTFCKLWPECKTPEAAAKKIEESRVPCADPRNLEEHVLNLVGREIYEKLIKGYTEKQWGRGCDELPASIMRRIPIRFTFDNNYFNDRWQGVPIGGYTKVFEHLFNGCDIKLNVDYLEDRHYWDSVASHVVYTGAIDEFFDYRYGPLEYRGLRFEHKVVKQQNVQGVAVMNYTDRATPYTRVIEHKHFEFGNQPSSVISYEYPIDWHPGDEPYYPMEDSLNRSKYDKYLSDAMCLMHVHFGGRLGEYRYYDMQDTVKSALAHYRKWFGCSE